MPTQEDFYRSFLADTAAGRLAKKDLNGPLDPHAKFDDFFLVCAHGRSIYWGHVYMQRRTTMESSFRRLKTRADGMTATDPPSDELLNDCVFAAPPEIIVALTSGTRGRAALHYNPMLTETQAETFVRMCIAQYASQLGGGTD